MADRCTVSPQIRMLMKPEGRSVCLRSTCFLFLHILIYSGIKSGAPYFSLSILYLAGEENTALCLKDQIILFCRNKYLGLVWRLKQYSLLYVGQNTLMRPDVYFCIDVCVGIFRQRQYVFFSHTLVFKGNKQLKTNLES